MFTLYRIQHQCSLNAPTSIKDICCFSSLLKSQRSGNMWSVSRFSSFVLSPPLETSRKSGKVMGASLVFFLEESGTGGLVSAFTTFLVLHKVLSLFCLSLLGSGFACTCPFSCLFWICDFESSHSYSSLSLFK